MEYLNKMWLKERFPEDHGLMRPSWGLISWPDAFNINIHWYKAGEFILGTFSNRPRYIVGVVGRPETVVRRDFNFDDPMEDLEFITALAEPKRMALCAGIGWTKGILDYWYTQRGAN